MTAATPTELHAHLQKYFEASSTYPRHIGGGRYSKAFRFFVDDVPHILRASPWPEDFDKDSYAFEHYNSPSIPVPEQLYVAPLNTTFHVAVSKEVQGHLLDDLEAKDNYEWLPELMKTHDAIRQIDISHTTGWGIIRDGNGRFSTARDSLLHFYSKKLTGDRQGWESPAIKDSSYIEAWYKAFRGLLIFVPEERWLCHGDFGFDNAIFQDGKIVAIIDWAEAHYGDFVGEVAWLQMWSQGFNYAEAFQTHYSDIGLTVPHYRQRLEFHCLRIAIFSVLIDNPLETDAEMHGRLESSLRSIEHLSGA